MTDILLDTRAGLPDDLRYLVERYPRGDWAGHANIQGMASFWLERHAMFREMGGMLTAGIADFREGGQTAEQFGRWFAPRLNWFLQGLDGHHHVEDSHYFPVFAAAEPRLKRGFDILDADHHAIHEALERNAEAANGFLRAQASGGDALRFAADGYASQNERLVRLLARHLDDEEDLIIPLILDRGDGPLGIG